MEKEFARLDSTHRKLLDLIEPVDDERFARRPSPNEWSIAEIVHHLCMVEQRVIDELERALAAPPFRMGLLQRLMPVGFLVGSRVVRVKAPRAVEPLDAPSKEEAIANYQSVRARLKEFSARLGRGRLEQLAMKHPFLGKFDGVRAVEFAGHHERRHCKQIKETIRKIDRG
ncbi:MAG TPA: DinB family protein [Pyrinomonadaceae bacterium]|nr:DinB family protein [Pyrinomonadaceae bacterium]